MRSLTMTIRTLLAAGLVAALAAPPATAETVFFANLDGPTAGTTSSATGTATLTLNDAQTEVSYVVAYSGLEGAEGPAHFHRGAPGTYGPALVPLVATGSPRIGVWSVTPTEVAFLFDGFVYVNVHTDLYPDGEIRGDIAFQSVADEVGSWGAVKVLFR